jgi:hypothetical protein
MSENTEFEFDKFIVDIEKRNSMHEERKNLAQHVIDEDQRRRKRSELYHERWQNQIKWETK